ncbi:MAG: hypothetical protein R3C68_09325 [Myxococcota bacterium]
MASITFWRMWLRCLKPPDEPMGGMDDFDFEFDLMDDQGSSKSASVQSPQDMTLAEQVSDAAHAYASMLRSRVVSFGDRLERALQEEGSWPLLAGA